MIKLVMILDPETDAGRHYVGKMLRKRGSGGHIYVSAKRTHRFRRREEGLNDCEANRKYGKLNQLSVGSFWKTNPPGEVFYVGFGVELECF